MTESTNIHARIAEELLAKPLPNPNTWDPVDLAVFDVYRAMAHGILAIHSHLEQQQAAEQEQLSQAWGKIVGENPEQILGEPR